MLILGTQIQAQSIDVETVKMYSKLAIMKEFNQSSVRNITVSIKDWNYDYNKGRFNIEFETSYEFHSVFYWAESNNHDCILQCDLNGQNAKFKYVEAFGYWRNWDSLYP